MENDKIYDMRLHEVIQIDFTKIMRVAGGWTYTEFTEHDDYTLSTTFVPFSKEFLK